MRACSDHAQGRVAKWAATGDARECGRWIFKTRLFSALSFRSTRSMARTRWRLARRQRTPDHACMADGRAHAGNDSQ